MTTPDPGLEALIDEAMDVELIMDPWASGVEGED